MNFKRPWLCCLVWLMLWSGVPAIGSPLVFTIDTSGPVHPISPYIYGTNFGYNGRALERSGGNRWTAYNWETNASHAGSDWFHQNDTYLVRNWTSEYEALGYYTTTPGAAVWRNVRNARLNHAAALVTVPIIGRVSRDASGGGDVGQTWNWLTARFIPSLAVKPAPLSLSPDLTDNAVYQDEFVHWLEHTFFPQGRDGHPGDPPIFYCLDNEPALWAYTHARVHPSTDHYAQYLAGTRAYYDVAGAPVTYDALVLSTIEMAASIKDVTPQAMIFGPVLYGYNAYINLQSAPDATGTGFIDHYLERLALASHTHGRRLLDILDLHWYPEARGDNIRITSDQATEGLVQARIQAPRSLWDPTYEESSWIRNYVGGPIRLIPWLKEKIAVHYPGTGLAITEYHYGGGGHISGGIAQADVLGIFGRENLFAACLWTQNPDNSFIYGGFDMYRNFDGQGASFGDLSVSAVSPDAEKASVYASLDSTNPNRMVIVAINKTATPLQVSIRITQHRRMASARMFRLAGTSPLPAELPPLQVAPDNTLACSLQAMSVSTLELSAAPQAHPPVWLLLDDV